jgi:amino acid permease
MNLDRNQIWVGIVVGLLVPFVSYAVLLMLSEKLDEWLPQYTGDGESVIAPRTLYLLAICANLLPFHLFDRRRWGKGMRGIIMATIVLGVAWMVYFGKMVLAG